MYETASVRTMIDACSRGPVGSWIVALVRTRNPSLQSRMASEGRMAELVVTETWNVPTIRTPVTRWTAKSQHLVDLSMPCVLSIETPH